MIPCYRNIWSQFIFIFTPYLDSKPSMSQPFTQPAGSSAARGCQGSSQLSGMSLTGELQSGRLPPSAEMQLLSLQLIDAVLPRSSCGVSSVGSALAFVSLSKAESPPVCSQLGTGGARRVSHDSPVPSPVRRVTGPSLAP